MLSFSFLFSGILEAVSQTMALAVSAILYAMALAWAPATVSIVYDTLNLPKKASEFPEKSKGNSLNRAGHIESPLHYIYPLSKNHQR